MNCSFLNRSPYIAHISQQSANQILLWLETSLSLEYLASDIDAHMQTSKIMDSIARIMSHHWESNHELTVALIAKSSMLNLISKLKFEHLKPPTVSEQYSEQWFNSWYPSLNGSPLLALLNYLIETLNELHSKQDVSL